MFSPPLVVWGRFSPPQTLGGGDCLPPVCGGDFSPTGPWLGENMVSPPPGGERVGEKTNSPCVGFAENRAEPL